MKTILMQKCDIKSRMWAKAADSARLGKILPLKGSPILVPLGLLREILFGRGIPSAVCFRYLNDYPSLLKTIARLSSEAITIAACKILSIKVLWICHNIDAETLSYHRRVSNIRRRMLARAASSIFVTDELLAPIAEETLNCRCRIQSVSFGGLPADEKVSLGLSEALVEAARQIKDKIRASGHPVVGMWIGTPVDKSLAGIRSLVALAEAAENERTPLGFVVVGPLSAWLEVRDSELLHRLSACENIALVDEYIDAPAESWRSVADFVFKPLDDVSVSMTSYNAAKAGLPLVCHSNSFLQSFVSSYRLGFGICPGALLAPSELVEKVRAWDSAACADFLQSKTWERGAHALFRGL